jgi:predicted ribosome quality control (RQC) complex YloA/Tae2 family protein
VCDVIANMIETTYLQAAGEKKHLILIENGVRIHVTNYNRERPQVPSVFTMKLRKLLRTKRLESVEQQGLDRLLVLSFGYGEANVKVILEFYALVIGRS